MTDEKVQLTQDEERLMIEFEAYVKAIADGFSENLKKIEKEKQKEIKEAYRVLKEDYEKEILRIETYFKEQIVDLKRIFDEQSKEFSEKNKLLVQQGKEQFEDLLKQQSDLEKNSIILMDKWQRETDEKIMELKGRIEHFQKELSKTQNQQLWKILIILLGSLFFQSLLVHYFLR